MAEVIELPDGLLFQIYVNRREIDDNYEVSAQLVRMPSDGGLMPDVVVKTWTIPVHANEVEDREHAIQAATENVKIVAARDLRALSTAIDGMAIVRYIEVRNDKAEWDNEARAAQSVADAVAVVVGGPPTQPGSVPLPIMDGLDILKVVVELEHEPYVQRTVFSRVLEPLAGMLNSSSSAYGFADREIDPVAARWREQRQQQGAPQCAADGCTNVATHECQSSVGPMCDKHKSSCCQRMRP